MNKIFALGYFDSIHIGHRALLREGMRIAQQNNAKLYVVTFNDNFLSVLGRREEEIFLLEEILIFFLMNLIFQILILITIL